MNREILFHGKRIDNGEWVEGVLPLFNDRIAYIVYDGDAYESTECGLKTLIHDRYFEVDPTTVGQFTGLADKNGKKIFEGDICKVGSYAYKVEFLYSQWWFVILSKKVYCCPYLNSHCGERCEIIGNIHDNPELLEATT